MQHLENDMDDLFQRAAENYPLQSGKDDWESVAKRITEESKPADVTPNNITKKVKRFIYIFLLLFIASAGWFLFTNNPGKVLQSVNNTNPPKENKNNFNSNHFKNNSIVTTGNGSEDVAVDKTKSNSYRQPVLNSTGTTSSYSINPAIDIDNADENTNFESEAKNNHYVFVDDYFKKNTEELFEESLRKSIEEISFPNKTLNALINENSNNNKPVRAEKKRGIYIGIASALDFSKVHSTPFNSGFDLGLLLGFRVNNKLSFETGVILNKKNYSSSGSNFDMKTVRSTMPPGMTINSLQSKSSLIEIPIKAKYDIINKSKTAFFIAGGISSYIMTKENNMYNANLNGNLEKFRGVYNKNDYRFPADANISIGYEHNISRQLELRIEPFLKIPLQGIGVGSLPVTSAGLQIGITSHLK